ncbi:MAG: hypothetical protein AAGI38_04145, partial [Bacteroidota bacterium]
WENYRTAFYSSYHQYPLLMANDQDYREARHEVRANLRTWHYALRGPFYLNGNVMPFLGVALGWIFLIGLIFLELKPQVFLGTFLIGFGIMAGLIFATPVIDELLRRVDITSISRQTIMGVSFFTLMIPLLTISLGEPSRRFFRRYQQIFAGATAFLLCMIPVQLAFTSDYNISEERAPLIFFAGILFAYLSWQGGFKERIQAMEARPNQS